jgi:hypothetical protein
LSVSIPKLRFVSGFFFLNKLLSSGWNCLVGFPGFTSSNFLLGDLWSQPQ